ncbi:MAG: hypothetical protein ACE149_06600 [Armatimonadota bacterium]
MEPRDGRNDLFIPGYVSRTKPDIITSVLVMAQVAVGVALAATAGPVFARAMVGQSLMLWIIGGVCLVTGVALAAAGLTSSKRRVQSLLRPRPRTPAPEAPRDPSVPMLGALLVYKYQLITEAQLQRALDQQEREKRKGRSLLLGDVLREMKLVKESDLRTALDYQRSRSEASKR